MTVGLVLLIGIVLIAGGAVVAPRLHVPLPLLLVVLGVLVALIPGAPTLRLVPDVVLNGVLPPLLYAAAAQASLLDLKRGLGPVLALAVGPVVLTTLAVGFAVHAVLPGLALAAALALGAAVAPPDAVATTALGRTIGMPRRLTELLEDESLLNDPVALTALGVALAAYATEITPLTVAADLGIAVGAGVVSGMIAGVVSVLVLRRLTDTVTSTLVSFAVPYLAFLPAQAVGGSGVLAVVIAGLIYTQRAPMIATPRSRIATNVNWRTVDFALQNVVFLLIGLQLPSLIEGVRTLGLGLDSVLTVCGVVLGVVVLARFVFVFASAGLVRLLRARHRLGFGLSTVLAWAGMRGVVTLASSFLLPEGALKPLLQLAAFTVVGGTLLLQGLTLGPLVRRLGLRAPDAAEDALQAAELMDRAVASAERRLDGLLTGEEPEAVVAALRARNAAQSSRLWERLGGRGTETPTMLYQRLRLQMLDAQRKVVLDARANGYTDDVVLRVAFRRIDQEEAQLDSGEDLPAGDRGEDLIDPHSGVGNCEHLQAAPLSYPAKTPGECEDCVREGTTWVHLRECLTCGHVGCCDSSERRHATGHFSDTQHPVMRSAEPGEAWRWCYVHAQLG